MNHQQPNQPLLLLTYMQDIASSDKPEHRTIDPDQILKIGIYEDYDGVVVNHAIARRYYAASPFKEELMRKLPLIIHMHQDDDVVVALDEAENLGAKTVVYGFSLFDLPRLAVLLRAARKKGMRVFGWLQHTDFNLKNTYHKAFFDTLPKELDMLIVNEPDMTAHLRQNNAKRNIFLSLSEENDEAVMLKKMTDAIASGIQGFLVNQTVWHSHNPTIVSKKMRAIH